MLQEEINTYFETRETELIEILSKLVAVKSVREDPLPGMPYGKGPADALAVGLEIAREMGFITRNYDNYVGLVDLNTQETRLGILCHLDVVGEGVGWDTPPYTAVLKDGLLYGRGTSDDKGPTVAALLALRAVKDMGIPLKFNARLIMGTDEETGSSDIAYYFAREKTPPYVFSPDAEFPVYNTEKGSLRPVLSKTWVVSEALPRIVSVKGGYRLNVVPPRAEAVIEGLSIRAIQGLSEKVEQETGVKFVLAEEDGQVKIDTHGRGEHAASPQKGCNAITALLSLLAALPFAESDSFAAIQTMHALFPHGDFYGKALGIAQSDEITGPLTLSFNIYEQTLTGFSGQFDSRTPLCTTKENSVDVIAAKFQDLGIHMEGKHSAPHHTPCDTEFVQSLLRAYEQYTGEKGYCKSTGGGTYVHNIEGGVAFGAAMPGFESNVHGANEFTNVKDLITAAKIFTQVIVDMCA